VRTIDLGAHNPGSFTVAWDGRDAKGGAAPAGSYTIQINATNTDGKPVTVSTATRGQVSGISFDSGGAPSLIVGGEHIKLSDVSEIKERNTP
jgi:flagellar basal-body rod modification protein FlgD